MTDETSSLILERLRRIDDKLDTAVGEIRALRLRTSATAVQVGALNRRFDRLDGRVARIEARLGMVQG